MRADKPAKNPVARVLNTLRKKSTYVNICTLVSTA
jgi:hypothetical protein